LNKILILKIKDAVLAVFDEIIQGKYLKPKRRCDIVSIKSDIQALLFLVGKQLTLITKHYNYLFNYHNNAKAPKQWGTILNIYFSKNHSC
jgi:SHS2 domain-containing protein